MAIDLTTANGQANQLAGYASQLETAKTDLNNYKSLISINWQGQEVTYIIQGIDKAISEINSAISQLNGLSIDVRNTAAAIHAEEEAARKAAAEEAARQQAAAAEAARQQAAAAEAARQQTMVTLKPSISQSTPVQSSVNTSNNKPKKNNRKNPIQEVVSDVGNAVHDFLGNIF